MESVKTEWLPLPEWARQQRIPWHRAYDAVLTGAVESKRVGARWMVRSEAAPAEKP